MSEQDFVKIFGMEEPEAVEPEKKHKRRKVLRRRSESDLSTAKECEQWRNMYNIEPVVDHSKDVKKKRRNSAPFHVLSRDIKDSQDDSSAKDHRNNIFERAFNFLKEPLGHNQHASTHNVEPK
jgi:hypothetical protein